LWRWVTESARPLSGVVTEERPRAGTQGPNPDRTRRGRRRREKQFEKAALTEVPTVEKLSQLWLARYITPKYKHPDVVERVLRLHIHPVIGALAPKDVKPMHVDRILQRTVAGGAHTVANDALLYVNRMFKMAVRNQWIERNPAADFEISDAGGSETPRDRALALQELEQLATAMRETPSFAEALTAGSHQLLPSQRRTKRVRDEGSIAICGS